MFSACLKLSTEQMAATEGDFGWTHKNNWKNYRSFTFAGGLGFTSFSRRVVVRLIVCKECTRRIRSMGLQTRLNITDFFPAYFALKTPSVQIGQSIWIVACLLQIPSCISLLCAALYMSVFWDSQSCVTLLSYQVCIIWQQTFRGFCQKFAINGDYTWTVQWTVDPGCAEGGD